MSVSAARKGQSVLYAAVLATSATLLTTLLAELAKLQAAAAADREPTAPVISDEEAALLSALRDQAASLADQCRSLARIVAALRAAPSRSATTNAATWSLFGLPDRDRAALAKVADKVTATLAAGKARGAAS